MEDDNVKEVQVTQYRCLVCDTLYTEEYYARECADRPIAHDQGVKIGDVIRITRGDGTGHTATVTNISIIGKDWPDLENRERYWHTVHLNASVNHPDFHNRFLTFDHYEITAD